MHARAAGSVVVLDALGLEISTPLPPNEVFANLVENCTRITEPFFLSKIKGENTGEDVHLTRRTCHTGQKNTRLHSCVHINATPTK